MELRGGAGARRRLGEIQAQLLSARQTARLPQQTLSERLGVASRTLRDWEKGYDTPSLRHLIFWAYALGFRLVIVDQPRSAGPPPFEQEVEDSFELREMRRLAHPLRCRRKASKLSQADLALLLGVSRASIQRWEDVEKFPRPIALIAWAGRLDCSVELNQATILLENPFSPPGDEMP